MAKKRSRSTHGSLSDMAPAIEAARTMATPVKALELGQAQRDLVDRIQPALKLSELSKTSELTMAISARQAAIKQLSELSKTSEMMKAISAQQAAIKQLSELSKTSEVMKAISAQQVAIKQLSELNKISEVTKAISAQQAAIKQLSELSKTSEVMKAISAQQVAIKQLSELNKTSEMMKALSAQQKMAEQVRASLELPHLETLTKEVTGLTSARNLTRAAAVTPPLMAHRSVLLDRPTAAAGDTTSTITITSARNLGQLIRAERERRKLSQQAFADLVGVGRRFISELENGKATLEFDKVLQVSSAGGIDVLTRRRR